MLRETNKKRVSFKIKEKIKIKLLNKSILQSMSRMPLASKISICFFLESGGAFSNKMGHTAIFSLKKFSGIGVFN